MRKILLISVCLVASLLCFSSCEANKSHFYTLYFDLYYFTDPDNTERDADQKTADWDIIKSYFDNHIDFSKQYTFQGKYDDACRYAATVYENETKGITTDDVVGLIHDGDIVQLVILLNDGQSSILATGYQWVKDTSISDSK